MQRAGRLIAAIAAAALVLAPGLVLAPDLAMARAGGGGSMGSRGSMTYSAPPATRTAPYGGTPMQRSMTQPSQPNTGYNQANPGYGYNQRPRSGFMSGLMGGLIGAGLGGLLLSHGFLGGGLGFGGFIGFLLQLFLIVVLARFVWRLLSGNRRAMMANGPMGNGQAMFGRMADGGPGYGTPNAGMAGGGMAGTAAGASIQVTPADYQQFEQALYGIQAAWSAHDLNALQAMATPEMVSYFAQQLADQVSRGVRNTVSDVRLQSGDLAQAWSERGVDYATVAMRFSMIDVTRDAAGRVVDGSPTEHQTATELWTFLRSRDGQWILSAIQQAR
ncbi:Tim44 domain-containing protein [Rhodopila sp.]|uniref:Tim44 domain-containing protein n=1 Tax=Rhodopila sp. TaxID=2480087 RepID=UPI002D7E96D1|nr:Tim44-like domain-containing protein [Rhodopila sp.]